MASVMATSKVDQDPVLQAVLDLLRDQALAEYEGLLAGRQTQWMMPPVSDAAWNGELHDYQAIGLAFSREKTGEAFVKATSNASSPGTTGDLISAVLQADYLGVMERAFRDRHTMSRARAMCHSLGRRRGHGSESGPLARSVKDFIRALINESRKA